MVERGRRTARARASAALAGILLAGVVAGGVDGATPAPSEPCVPGSVWEDPASGVKYLCIYDEAYGGPRWELLAADQVGGEGTTARSSATGCVSLTVGLSMRSGGGGSALVRSYRWPCTSTGDRWVQPSGELRVRTIVQRFKGSTWTTCRDTGYVSSAGASASWVHGVDMGGAADCGSGWYRTWGLGQVYQGGGWRGSSRTTPAAWLP